MPTVVQCKTNFINTLGVKMFAQGVLFIKNVPEDGNEEGRVATPTSISIFDSYDMKSLYVI